MGTGILVGPGVRVRLDRMAADVGAARTESVMDGRGPRVDSRAQRRDWSPGTLRLRGLLHHAAVLASVAGRAPRQSCGTRAPDRAERRARRRGRPGAGT